MSTCYFKIRKISFSIFSISIFSCLLFSLFDVLPFTILFFYIFLFGIFLFFLSTLSFSVFSFSMFSTKPVFSIFLKVRIIEDFHILLYKPLLKMSCNISNILFCREFHDASFKNKNEKDTLNRKKNRTKILRGSF